MRTAFVVLVMLAITCGCGGPQPNDTQSEFARVIVYYNSGRFRPAEWIVSASKITIEPGGQYSTPSEGGCTPTVLRNVALRIQKACADRLAPLADFEGAKSSVPAEMYLLVIERHSGAMVAATIPHSQTVRRDGPAPRDEWVSEMIRDIHVLRRYLSSE